MRKKAVRFSPPMSSPQSVETTGKVVFFHAREEKFVLIRAEVGVLSARDPGSPFEVTFSGRKNAI
jgi:hypothetical protein